MTSFQWFVEELVKAKIKREDAIKLTNDIIGAGPDWDIELDEKDPDAMQEMRQIFDSSTTFIYKWLRRNFYPGRITNQFRGKIGN